MSPDDRAACGVAAALLRRGRLLHRLSAPLTLAAVVAIPALAVMRGPLLLTLDAMAVLAAGICETFFAARAALDADLFGQIASGDLDLERLDTALSRCGLAAREKLGRPLNARVAGALRLLRLQAVWLLLQLASTVIVLFIAAGVWSLEWLAKR